MLSNHLLKSLLLPLTFCDTEHKADSTLSDFLQSSNTSIILFIKSFCLSDINKTDLTSIFLRFSYCLLYPLSQGTLIPHSKIIFKLPSFQVLTLPLFLSTTLQVSIKFVSFFSLFLSVISLVNSPSNIKI